MSVKVKMACVYLHTEQDGYISMQGLNGAKVVILQVSLKHCICGEVTFSL